jgi:UDP-N-acetyl-D-mannosaminuronic acid dehydrogenase
VCVVGLGRVGLPTAVAVARAGFRVVGVDRDPAVRARVAAGEPGFPEPGLAEALRERPLEVAARPVRADGYVICVGRPADAGGGGDPTSDVRAALGDVAAAASPGALVLLECTVPVGVTDELAAAWPDLRLAVAPERVWPGAALAELASNPRLVGGDPAVAAVAATFVRRWCAGAVTETDARTAELAKLVENTARDVQIALANTVADVARRSGVDPRHLLELVASHPRVHLLRPGIGVGGPCLPVDPWLLGPEVPPLVAAARAVNDALPGAAAARVAREPGTIGLLGLAYKADTDDTRRSPAVEVARALAHRGALAHDPHVRHVIAGVEQRSYADVLACDVVVRLVDHRAFHGWQAAARPGARTLDLVGGWA